VEARTSVKLINDACLARHISLIKLFRTAGIEEPERRVSLYMHNGIVPACVISTSQTILREEWKRKHELARVRLETKRGKGM
jgi:hypothetical protein